MFEARNVRFLYYPELSTKALYLNCADTLLVFLALKTIAKVHFKNKNVFSRLEIVKLIMELLNISETRSRQILESGDGRFWRLGKGQCGLMSYLKALNPLIDSETLPAKPINLAFNDLLSSQTKSIRPSTLLNLFVFACAVSKTDKPVTKATIAQQTGQSERNVIRWSKHNPFLRVRANMKVLGTFINPITAREFCRDTYVNDPGVFMLHSRSCITVVKRMGNSYELSGFNRMGFNKRHQQLKSICGYKDRRHLTSSHKDAGTLLTRHGESRIWEPIQAAEMADDARLLKVGLSYV